MKHTPGPWIRDKHESLRGSNYKQVSVWGSGLSWGERSEETEANSRLIAAAPELLITLKALRFSNAGSQERNRAWNDALALIERIEGPQ